MCIYHALINALSTHMIHMNLHVDLNTSLQDILYTHFGHDYVHYHFTTKTSFWISLVKAMSQQIN